LIKKVSNPRIAQLYERYLLLHQQFRRYVGCILEAQIS